MEALVSVEDSFYFLDISDFSHGGISLCGQDLRLWDGSLCLFVKIKKERERTNKVFADVLT